MTSNDEPQVLKKNPLVSVIIPTYNRADYIAEALQSVFDQTYQNFEILLVDDGSQDETETMVAPFQTDPRLQFFRQENQGQAVARNLGLERSRGEFICFLDSDNRWLPHKLAASLQVFAEKPETDVVYADVITIDMNGKEISRKNPRRYSGRIARYMFRDNCVSMNTTMTRRRCFDEMGGMETERRVADDYDLWLRFSARYRFEYIPDHFAEYRMMPDQISSDKSRRYESNEMLMNVFQERFPDALTSREFSEGWCLFHTRKGRHLAGRGRFGESLKQYAAALRHRLFHPAPWRALIKLLIRRSG